jgi:alpha-mannosidase
MKEKHPEVEVKYSTMQAYFDELKKANVAWPVYQADLLPTLTDMSEYWSGFYTTDPAFKRRVHDYTEFTRAVASLASI